MANIKEYNSPVDTLQPDQIGPLALARAGNSIRADYRETGQLLDKGFTEVASGLKNLGDIVHKHEVTSDLQQGMAYSSQLVMDKTDEWNQTAKDAFNNNPNDTTVGHRFVESLRPQLENVSGAFKTDEGKRWWAEHSGRILEHFAEKVTADSATIAGEAVRSNLLTAVDGWSQTVAKDPSALAFTQQTIKDNFEHMITNGNLTADQVAKLRAEALPQIQKKVDEAAFASTALHNPGQAEAMFNSGAFPHIDGKEAETFLNQAKRNARIDANLARAEADRAETKRSEATASGILNRLADARTSGDLAAVQGLSTEVLRLAGHGLKPEMAHSLNTYLDHQSDRMEANRITVSRDDSLSKIQDLKNRITLGEDDPNAPTFKEIIDAKNQGYMDNKTFEQLVTDRKLFLSNPELRGEMAEFKKAIDSITPMIDKSSLYASDGYGRSRAKEFYADMYDAFVQGRKNGVSVKDLLDRSGGANSIFKDANMYLVRPQEQIDRLGQAGTLPTPVKVMIRQKQVDDENRKKQEDLDAAAAAQGFKLPPPPSSVGRTGFR